MKAEDVQQHTQLNKERMEALIHGAADDIRKCGNACDAYLKTRILTRVIKGPLWDSTLVEFVGRFRSRKKDFMFALSLHTGLAVDSANEKLDSLQKTTQRIEDMYVSTFCEGSYR